ncbi:MAG: winged helix-turn-helix transcriptional regulator [Chloroflexi bacterium]|nr:winged helix-turn-helix transcriptional regulator [Chloroflexota bacterium]
MSMLDKKTSEILAELFRALGDPTRLRLIACLLEKERSVGDLAEALGMSLSAVSHQLGILRRMRIVRGRREGRHVYYTLDDEHVSEIFTDALRHVEHS